MFPYPRLQMGVKMTAGQEFFLPAVYHFSKLAGVEMSLILGYTGLGLFGLILSL